MKISSKMFLSIRDMIVCSAIEPISCEIYNSIRDIISETCGMDAATTYSNYMNRKDDNKCYCKDRTKVIDLAFFWFSESKTKQTSIH